MFVLHVTPNLPPTICGLGDYATNVGSQMEHLSPRTLSDYIAIGHNVGSTPLSDRSPDWFWNLVLEQINQHECSEDHLGIVLHYSGYGYSPDGVPRWLANALKSRPTWATKLRLVTFFHELYATGWPWRKAFWHSRQQRTVAVDIAKSTDSILTNRAESASWLESVSGRPAGTIEHLHVPSNVGEPDAIPDFNSRPFQAVVFGGRKVKKHFLQDKGAILTAQVCKRLNIARLVVIGNSIDINRYPFEQLRIDLLDRGFLSAGEVSQELLNTRVAFFNYNPQFLSKSGILAALASHGVAIIVPKNYGRFFDTLLTQPGSQITLSSILEAASPRDNFRALVNNANAFHQWSKLGTAERHAMALSDALQSPSTIT